MITAADSILEVENLSLHYGDTKAVDGVSFGVRPGEILAVLGRNGAGKTSTLETCVGLRRPTSGSVRVLGHDIATASDRLKARIGIMLQDGGIAPSARVHSLVHHYCRLYDRGVDADELIHILGLERRKHAAWRRLSGGERQRFSLALALSAKPDVAFLDEPTAGVDFEGRETIRTIILDLARRGCGVIVATHDLDETQRVAQRVLMLHNGKVLLHDDTANLCSGGRRLEDIVREAMRSTVDENHPEAGS